MQKEAKAAANLRLKLGEEKQKAISQKKRALSYKLEKVLWYTPCSAAQLQLSFAEEAKKSHFEGDFFLKKSIFAQFSPAFCI